MSTSRKNIIYGGDFDNKETKGFKSFGQYLLHKLKQKNNEIIMIDAVTGEEYSAIEVYRRVVRLIFCLQRLNIREGSVVGICSENRIEFAVTLFATLSINATAAPYSVTYTESELHHAVNLSKPRLMFASPASIKNVSKVAQTNNFIKHTIIYADYSPVGGVLPFPKLYNYKGIMSGKNYKSKPTDMQQNVALLICSSGTTGLPKGVQITQMNIMSSIQTYTETITFDGSALCVIPWNHVYGCMRLALSCCLNTILIYMPSFDEHLFLNSIQKYKINIALMVPPLMVWLAKSPIVDKYDLSSLSTLLCGAAPLSKETEDAVKKRIGVKNIFQGYGLSESTAGVVFQTEKFNKPGSVGILRPGIYAKIVDPETGDILGPNQRGEICFKGNCIMKGYVGDKKSTDETIRDGWLHTGDIGYYDKDLEFFVVDRLKELIKYKAFQVPPAEIEGLLLTNPKVKDAAVIGKQDEACGELPFAFIVKQPNVELTSQEVIDFVAKNTSPAKQLRGGVQFVDEIPKNASGKILRRLLRERLNQPKSKL